MALLSDKERKEPFTRSVYWLSFSSVVDLSEPVVVTMIGTRTEISGNMLAREISAFTAWHVRNILPQLNGFSGYDTIQWNLSTLKIV